MWYKNETSGEEEKENGLRNKKDMIANLEWWWTSENEVVRANENMMTNFDDISIPKYSYFPPFFPLRFVYYCGLFYDRYEGHLSS